MSVSKVQLTGGNFQDGEGNVLADGYLLLQLSQDALVTGVAQIGSGVAVKIKLNSSGSIDTTVAQSVWGNDQLSPPNTFYTVTGYTSKSQLAWGPNYQQVIGNGGTFDVGTWVPNQVTNWTPPLQVPILKTNGVVNVVQNLQNLVQGSNITIVSDDDGDVTISASGGGGVTFNTPGLGGFWNCDGDPSLGAGGSLAGPSGTGQLLVMQKSLSATYTIRKVVFTLQSDSGANNGTHVYIGIYSADGTTKLLDTGAILTPFNTSATTYNTTLASPVTLPPGTYYIAFGIDTTSPVQTTGLFPFDRTFQTLNTNYPRIGTAANVISGGALPATLGTVTGADEGPGNVWFEP